MSAGGLPFLPGFTFTNLRKQDFRKPQMLTVTSGLMGARAPRADELEREASTKTMTLKTTAPPAQPVESFPDYIPAHVAYEHLVLRFYAYFRESIDESAEENSRVRYVHIYVYLEDDTVMVEESRTRNSGIAQGVLLRRMRVLNPSGPTGTLYTAEDFNVGMNIDIFGIVYRIYACDEFTEKYFQSVGRELGAFEQPPDDLYSIKRKLTERPIRVTYINTDKTNLRRFLDYDGKVLRFYTIWDDRKALFGEQRKFILHYFLVDGTIEIRQVLPLNSGRDPVSQFLKKTLLTVPGTNRYYDDSDLRIGTTVHVFNRDFFIYDADQFTKDWIDQKYGKQDWTPIHIDEGAQHAQQTPTTEIPPYNGWGDEEDSIGYCYSLHPKPPRKNIVKLIEKDGQLLRFAAKFKNPLPQDVGRLFVIAYYLADDTVAVFEKQQRNSGFREGKFIQRGKHKNPLAGNRYFIASDFKVGEEIQINGFTFVTLDADEYAMNYMEGDADSFPQSDLFSIVMPLRSEKEKIKSLREEFEAVDPELDGYVSVAQAETSIMKAFGLQLHEAKTITRRWSDEKGFDYLSFMSALN